MKILYIPTATYYLLVPVSNGYILDVINSKTNWFMPVDNISEHDWNFLWDRRLLHAMYLGREHEECSIDKINKNEFELVE